MPLPPMYFPVYPLHFRLPDPGLHANPLMQTPPMFHVEGLHTVQWALSDQGKLSKTVSGDNQVFALRNFDTGSWIPHMPLPLIAGPFLADTWNNSKYVILFHQPNVQMDGKAVGVFFWGAAAPWRCWEWKLPLPKFLAKRSVGGALRKAQKAKGQKESARKKLTELKDRLELADRLESPKLLSPDQDAEIRKEIRGEEKKFAQYQETERKQNAAYHDAQPIAQDVKNDVGKPDHVSPFQKDVREYQIDERVKKELKAEEQQRANKNEADARARQVRIDAERRETHATAIHRGEVGARGGTPGTFEEAEEHEARAAKLRTEASEYDQAARQHEEAAKAHRKNASEARKAKSQRDYQQESARQYQDKHGEGRNPYKDATGAGNVKVAFPSFLGHVPLPSTVQIYMSWTAIGENLLRAVLSSLVDLLKGYVGFVFDAMLPQGNGAVAAWAMDFAKGLATGTAYEAAQKYLLEDRLSIKVTQKLGPAAVSAELKRDLQTGEWGWKAAAKPTEDSGLPAGLEVQVDYKEPIKLAGQFHPELTPDFLAQPSSGTAPPAATPQATPGPAPSEASYVCTVDNPPVDYSSGPALSGAPAP